MIGFYIGVECNIDFNEVVKLLFSLTGISEIGNYDDGCMESANIPTIVVRLSRNSSEFGTLIDFWNFPGPQNEDIIQPVAVGIGSYIAEKLSCKVICEGSMWGDDNNYPGYSVIIDGGKFILADDYGTDFGDGEGGPVREIRELKLESSEFLNLLHDVVNGA